MAKLNKKGITLVEILGAIVISSIGIAILSTAIVLIVRATNDTMMNNRANSTMMIIEATINNELEDFIATDITTCGVTPTSTCFVLEKYYTRTLDPGDNTIKDIPFDADDNPVNGNQPGLLKIEVKNNVGGQLDLFINDVSAYNIYSLEGTPFSYQSITITYDPIYANITSAGSGTLTLITLELTMLDTNNRAYPFFITYSFRARDIIT